MVLPDDYPSLSPVLLMAPSPRWTPRPVSDRAISGVAVSFQQPSVSTPGIMLPYTRRGIPRGLFVVRSAVERIWLPFRTMGFYAGAEGLTCPQCLYQPLC
uniref:Uncharacterized protein n=1 Tax=uncultured marine microorganism HF4000_010I05 TaxID=455517 RepID=B3T1K5_9ZZZZ|nr:hypothetical protein ALOHA_HF4000010I05ctg1g28 [uncultured marine microorganism HF4000_010I05]